MCAVPNMAVFCSSLTSWFPGMSLTYFLNVFEIVLVASVITGITFVFTFHMRCISIVSSLYFRIFSASFLITFLSPEIATSINIHVPFSLSWIIMLLHSTRALCLLLLLLLLLTEWACFTRSVVRQSQLPSTTANWINTDTAKPTGAHLQHLLTKAPATVCLVAQWSNTREFLYFLGYWYICVLKPVEF